MHKNEPTIAQKRQFWNHRINPITGWKVGSIRTIKPYNVDVTASERDHHNYYENVAWK